jgi:hypothetical protein
VQCSTVSRHTEFHLSDNSLSDCPRLGYAAATVHRRPPGRWFLPYADDRETFKPAGFSGGRFFLLL